MTEPEHHDWWSQLTPFERASVRRHEKEIDRKRAQIEDLKTNKPTFLRTISRLELEIAGHTHIRYEYQNRGTQRARLGLKAKITKPQRKRRHMEEQRQAT